MNPRKFNQLLQNIKYDKRVIEEIYHEYFPQIVIHLKRRFGNRISAEDIAQDVFVNLMTTDRFPKVEHPTSWINKLADHKAIDKLRTQHIDIELTENISDTFYIDNVILKEDIKKALKKLDKESQIIIYLHHWEGYDYKEISQMLHISCNNVRVKVSRAYSVLKKLL